MWVVAIEIMESDISNHTFINEIFLTILKDKFFLFIII
ncbi:hypothetical protein CSC17_5163 [Klebsiella oxytoca]|nr:hypothetical protein CSC17_5163 [Klebsiella oxytoca]